MVKMTSKKISYIPLLLIALAIATGMPAASQQTVEVRLIDLQDQKVIKTDIVTIIFPVNGTNPRFLWYYNKDNRTVYSIHYIGLLEYFTLTIDPFKRKYLTFPEYIHKLFLEAEEAVKKGLRDVQEIIKDWRKSWHPPFLPSTWGSGTLQSLGT